MSPFSPVEYHAAERNAGLALALVGFASAASAGWIVRARGPWTAMAWPLVLGALVELGVGAGMALGAHRELARQATPNAETMVALASRVAGQVKSYRVATRVELGLLVLAALLSLGILRTGTTRAVFLGILLEAVALLCFDTFGLGRATQNLERLRANDRTPAVDSIGWKN